MEIQDFINILEGLYPYQLDLIKYARMVIGDDGEIDMEKVSFYTLDIAEAIEEAKNYSKATREAVECLKKLALS